MMNKLKQLLRSLLPSYRQSMLRNHYAFLVKENKELRKRIKEMEEVRFLVTNEQYKKFVELLDTPPFQRKDCNRAD